MKTLAIIPARGGSKGIPNKNLLRFDGDTLVDYAIKSALDSKLINKIILTSDSEKILKVGDKYNNIFKHNRSNELSSDKSLIIDTILEIVQNHLDFDFIVLLQPTSPLRKGSNIDEALNIIYDNNKINSVVSVVETNDIHPARMYWIENEKNTLKSIMPEYQNSRRQDIPNAYYRNGSIYITRIKKLVKCGEILINPIFGYKMNNSHYLNIDDKRDLLISEVLIKSWKNEK